MSRSSDHHPSDPGVRLVTGGRRHRFVWRLTLVITAVGMTLLSRAQETLVLSLDPQWENGEVRLGLVAPAGVYRVESSDTLSDWSPLVTFKGTGSAPVTTVAPPDRTTRFYRAVAESDPNTLTGDHFRTSDGDVVIHPVNHASFVLRWREMMIYNDPVGASSRYSGMPKADLILISHDHGDHFDAATLNTVRKEGTVMVAPAAVYSRLSAALKALTIPLANGGQTNVQGMTVEGIPAYNANHPKGAGNGYVLSLGGRRMYMSGDTGNIPEMRSLSGIDVAFVCMNVPFTMTIPDAITAVRAFRPAVVYPYHFRNQSGAPADLAAFQRGVSSDPGIEVRRRVWY